MRDLGDLPFEVQQVVASWLDGLDTILGPRLHAAYMYGSWVFPGSWVQDVDADVIVSDPFDDDDRTAVGELHDRLRTTPPGDDMDIWYILLDEARGRALPQTQLRLGYRSRAWALHRAHIHAGACIPLRGPEPTAIVPEATWSEIDEALQSELDFVTEAQSRYPQFSVLNGCRVLWSYTSGDVVVSKQEASDWALGTLPSEWHTVIRAAQAVYGRTASDEDTATLTERAEAFDEFVRERVARLR